MIYALSAHLTKTHTEAVSLATFVDRKVAYFAVLYRKFSLFHVTMMFFSLSLSVCVCVCRVGSSSVQAGLKGRM